jgi:NADH dehydrogenase FAD-containing subunit
MADKNIVVIGASYSGLLVAHSVAQHIIPKFPGHRLIIINPSPDFYHIVCGPRLAIDGKSLPNEKAFLNLAEAFKQYPDSAYDLIQGTVTGVDTTARSLEYTTAKGTTESLAYHALVIASGGKTPSPLFTSNPSTDDTRAALDAFRRALPHATSIVIAGGGPVAVETAAEMAEFLNGSGGWFSSRPSNPKATITVITSATRLLPGLRDDVAQQAERYLNRVGADVLYGTTVKSTTPADAGRSVATLTPPDKSGRIKVHLSSGAVLDADLYLPAYGIRPSAPFLPASLRAASGAVITNPATLRVDAAGPRVYALGEASSASSGGIRAVLDMAPVVVKNLARDLRAAEEGKDGLLETGEDAVYVEEKRVSQFVPVGRSKGVGQMFGWWVPSFFVWALKGRDFMVNSFMVSQYRFGTLVRGWKVDG